MESGKKADAIRLLLVEDNPGDAFLVEEFLEDAFEGPQVTHVETFLKAKKTVSSGDVSFDAILLDLSLPDSDGIDLVQQILKIAGPTPVIILTGYSNLDFSIESLSKGVSDYLLKDDLSSTLLYKSILYAIERNTFSTRLRKSEQNYRHLFEFSPMPMWVYDLQSLRFLDVNEAAIKNYGYSKEEFLEMTVRDIRPEDSRAAFDQAISNIRSMPGTSDKGIFRHRKKNGEIIQVEVEGSAIDYGGRPARLVLAEDITVKLKEEQRLKQLESVVTNTTESVVILEAEPGKKPGRSILYVNDAFTEMTQYGKEEVLGKSLHILNGPKTDQQEINRLGRAMDEWKICDVEFINYKKDGTPFWIHTSLVPVPDNQGNYIQWVAIARDITKQKTYEKKLRDSLKEKEVLLSEIHHRVKNNLAVISSLLQLQAFNTESDDLKKKLYDSVFRISSMASIHELLYQSDSFSQLDFTDILENLIQNLERVFGTDTEIEHTIDKQEIKLNINQAIPCSLLLNEVITNCYKHAFVGRDSGRVEACISCKDERVIVTISDNGIGLPDGLDVETTDSMGLHLVQVLTSQLKGKSSFSSDENGTAFHLEFNKSDGKGVGSSYLT